jgi:hypothetical protein
MLVIYADESGTNKSEVAPVIAGYIGRPVEWEKFCVEWPAMLNTHKVDYFHFREWVDALESARRGRPCKINKNPYQGKTEDKLKELLYDCAEIAGRQVPLGGMINLKNWSKINKGYPFKPLFQWFLKSIIEALEEHWPNFSEPIEIIFDQTDDRKWKNEIRDVFFEWGKIKKDSRFSEPIFRDKKIAPYTPLQAADMLAFWDRKKAEPRMVSGLLQDANLLDYILNRNMHPSGFYPTITSKLRKEVHENAMSYPSVMRAVFDKPRRQHGYD